MIEPPDPSMRDSLRTEGAAVSNETILPMRGERFVIERSTDATFVRFAVRVVSTTVERRIYELRERARIERHELGELRETTDLVIEPQRLTLHLSRESSTPVKKTVIDEYVDLRKTRVADRAAVSGSLRHEVPSVETKRA